MDNIIGKNDQERRLYRMLHWFVAVDTDRVNLDDLIHAYRGPGHIVRCDGDPSTAISVVAPPVDALEPALGCVAGWISEGE